MRHRVAHRKLGRVTEHRTVAAPQPGHALISHERIETTVPKAKELRPFVERYDHDCQAGNRRRRRDDQGAARPAPRAAGNRRSEVVGKLFDTIAPRFEGRPGGYTRILRIGYRRGDSAEMAADRARRQRIQSRPRNRRKESQAATPKKKSVGGRLRAAASRLRGKKGEGDEGKPGDGQAHRVPARKRTSTKRKTG